METRWIGVDGRRVKVLREEHVDLLLLDEREIVSVADRRVLHQIQHLRLRDRREEQTELDLVVAVLCVEPRLKLVVPHQREV